MKFGIRWYNPITGTWTQQDTLDAPLNPANANRYVFVGGDPINGQDPTGGCFIECTFTLSRSVTAFLASGAYTSVSLLGITGVGSALVNAFGEYGLAASAVLTSLDANVMIASRIAVANKECTTINIGAVADYAAAGGCG